MPYDLMMNGVKNFQQDFQNGSMHHLHFLT